METVIFFSTSSNVVTKLGDQPMSGVILRRLPVPYLENSTFDFSCIHFVANIDLKKISVRSAVNHLLSECSAAPGNHYMDLAGRRLSIHETSTIYAEADRIDQRYIYMFGNHPPSASEVA